MMRIANSLIQAACLGSFGCGRAKRLPPSVPLASTGVHLPEHSAT
jgi:hypothetical protein